MIKLHMEGCTQVICNIAQFLCKGLEDLQMLNRFKRNLYL